MADQDVYDKEDTIQDLERLYHADAAAESGSQKLADSQPGSTDMSGFEDSFAGSDSGSSGSQTLADRQGSGNGSNRGGAVGAGALAGAEADAASKPVNYTGNSDGKGKEQLSAPKSDGWRSWMTKKKAGVAGGIVGGGVGVSIFGMTLVSGPLEFIHLAEILHDGHFSSQENTGDSRMGKLFRFMRKGGSVGETRLSWMQSKYHTRILGKLSDIGIEPTYGTADTYNGFKVDTEHENSPYKGMTQEEAAAAFEQNTGIKPSLAADGKSLTVESKTFWTQKKSLNSALKMLGDSRLVTWVRGRILGKFGMVTMHPLKIVDKKINNTAAKVTAALKEKWKAQLSKGDSGPPVGVDASKANDGTVDKNGNPVPATPDEQTTAASAPADTKVSSGVLKGLATSKTVSIAGGVAAIAGVACALKAVNDNIAVIRYAQVIVPLIRIGMDAITVANQIKSGQDVDPAELQYLSQNFQTIDKVSGQVKTWYDTKQIRMHGGDNSGPDTLKDDGTKALITETSVPWLAWTEGLGPICSTAGQAVTGLVSIGIGIISGGVASTAVGLVAGVALTGPIIHEASSLLAGQAIPTEVGKNPGPTYGAQADEGAALGANANAIAMGGTALTTKQNSVLTAEAQQEQQQEFASQSFFARTFDVNDYHSLAGRFADNLGLGMSWRTNVNTLFGTVLSSAGSALSLPFNLYSSKAHADPTLYYNYGFPTYGFSQDDQDNGLVEDPYANAETAAKILDSNNQNGVPNYIQKAEDCFGVSITKGDQGWDVVPQKDVDVYDTKNYHPSDCAGPQVNSQGTVVAASKIVAQSADKPIMAQTAATPLTPSQSVDWLRIRFFILDTSVMEGYTCAEFNDDTSCANDGMSTATATATTNDPKALAQQIIANSKVTLGPTAKADLQAIANGQQVTPGPFDSSKPCAARAPVTIDPDLLQAILNIASNYSFTVDTLVSGHSCDTSRAPLGRSMDITQLNGTPIDWSGANLDSDKQFARSVAAAMDALLPGGTFVNGQPVNMPGVGVCHQDDISPPPIGINYYTDSCNKLVVDVGVAPSS